MSVTLIFSKVKSDYVRAPPQDEHRISDAVAGRNWRTLRRLWILLQRHRGSHRQEREVKSKELLNFTIISDYLLQDLILAKQRGHGRLDDRWSFNFARTDTVLLSVQAMPTRIKAVTEEDVWHWP